MAGDSKSIVSAMHVIKKTQNAQEACPGIIHPCHGPWMTVNPKWSGWYLVTDEFDRMMDAQIPSHLRTMEWIYKIIYSLHYRTFVTHSNYAMVIFFKEPQKSKLIPQCASKHDVFIENICMHYFVFLNVLKFYTN